MSRVAPAGRLQWADVAKGVCIVLVVLWHVTRKDYLQLPWDVGVPVTAAWGTFSELLLPVRMPLFFAISGLFAARQLDRPWRTVWTARMAPLLYLFVVWTLIHTVLLQLTPGFDTEVATGPLDLLAGLTITPGNLWYLLALAAYVGIARATRGMPDWTLGAALLLSAVTSTGLIPTPNNRAGLLMNLVWFLLGSRLASGSGRWRRLSLGRPVRRSALIVLVLVFGILAGLWQALIADAWFGVRPALGLLGILTGAKLAMALAGVPRVGDTLAALGQRTLPIYVMHLPLVALVHLGTTHLVGVDGPLAGSLVAATLYPIVPTALVVVVCLLLQRGIERSRLPWLLVAPWGRVAIDRDRSPSTPARL